jgi:hypothetical protein
MPFNFIARATIPHTVVRFETSMAPELEPRPTCHGRQSRMSG